jgi:hypothetical protein
MAAVASPYGLRPIGALSGSYNAQFRKYRIAASSAAIFTGDVVKAVSDGTVTVDAGTTAMKPVGIFMGCEYTNPTTNQLLQSPYWPNNAATDAYAFVMDNPFVVFKVQSDTACAQTTCFNNVAASTYAVGNVLFGISKVTVGTPAVTAGLPIRIIGFASGPDSAVGDAFTDLICCWNLNAGSSATTGHAFFTDTGI